MLGACGSSGGTTQDAPATAAGGAATAPAGQPVVIDVRTPAEFASGHLEGAINIDVQGSDFDVRIAELDPDGHYVVYCRSGNRSGQAIQRMAELGITDAVNGGSVEAAAQLTGLAVVES